MEIIMEIFVLKESWRLQVFKNILFLVESF